MWDIGAGKVAGTLSGNYGLVAGDGYHVRIWRADTYDAVRELTGPTNSVPAVVFSPDDGQLAGAARDGVVRVWDPAAGTLLKQLSP